MEPKIHINLRTLENELKKRTVLPGTWHYKINPQYEENLQFIYQTYNFDTVVRNIRQFPAGQQQYALNRWYNYWSNLGMMQIFAEHPRASQSPAAEDIILLDNLQLKIKSLVFPHAFSRTLRYAVSHKEELLYWLYRRTLRNAPNLIPNKLFIIFYRQNGDHWKGKAELHTMKKIVDRYLTNFDLHQLFRIHLPDNRLIYTDVLWIIKPGD